MKPLGKYNEIQRVRLQDADGEERESFLLTGHNVDKDFELDFKSDFFFNESHVAERKTVMTVHNLTEVKMFLLVNDINLPDTWPLVGGSRDMVIEQDLTFHWEEE